MIMRIFESLSMALYGNPALALGAAFLWGLLSVVLSPCHIASIPLIVGYISGQKKPGTLQALKLSGFFTLGILLMMLIIGAITGLMGRIMGDLGGWTEPLMGVLFLVIAFVIADIIKLPNLATGKLASRFNKGIWGAIILGFVLGIALGPCSFAFMAPILGIVFSSAGTDLIFALALVLAYIIGHCLVIILAGTFSGAVQSYLKWSTDSSGTKALRYICAALVFIAGIYLITKHIL